VRCERQLGQDLSGVVNACYMHASDMLVYMAQLASRKCACMHACMHASACLSCRMSPLVSAEICPLKIIVLFPLTMAVDWPVRKVHVYRYLILYVLAIGHHHPLQPSMADVHKFMQDARIGTNSARRRTHASCKR
jgi:hypothetical protein